MARHYLAQGGNPKTEYCFGTNTLPSVPYDPHQEVAPDARRGNIDYAITRCIDFGCGETPCNGCVTAACKGSIALAAYLRDNPIVVDDVIDVAYLPINTQLTEVYWRVAAPITPFTFDIQVADYDQDASAPPIILATGVSGAAIDMDVLDVRTINGGNALMLKTNGVLQIVIRDMPPTDNGGSPCGCEPCGGLCGLSLYIAPVVRMYETGCY